MSSLKVVASNATKQQQPQRRATPDGLQQLILASATVDDPYNPGVKQPVVVNLRHDVLRQWHSRKAIDDAQFAAGRWFQMLWEKAEIGGAGSMRYDKPKVDGGYPVDPLTEQVMQARQDLNGIAALLGMIDYPLMGRIVGQGVAVEAEARTGSWGDDRPERYVGRRVRQALTALSEHRGTKGPDKARIRGWREET